MPREIKQKAKIVYDIAVEVRRDYDGKTFSAIINRAIPAPQSREYRYAAHGDLTRSVVVDRQRGRGMDMDTLISRARAVVHLLGAEYDEDLHWPCAALNGALECHCPRCAGIANERAKS